jgi:hypothetical protein
MVLIDTPCSSGLDLGFTHLLFSTSTGDCTFFFWPFFSIYRRKSRHSSSEFLVCFTAESINMAVQSDFFWNVAPSGCVLGAAMVSLSISTYVARCISIAFISHLFFGPTFITHLGLPHSFWPKGQLGGLPVMGLALGDYTLMPQQILIYCLVWWFIQVSRCP